MSTDNQSQAEPAQKDEPLEDRLARAFAELGLIRRKYGETGSRDVDVAEANRVISLARKAIYEAINRLAAPQQAAADGEYHGLDTAERVCFYEQDFYVLSNFSSFTLEWHGRRFDTSEAAYHYEKFVGGAPCCEQIALDIYLAASAHEAFKIAERNKEHRRPDWDDVKVGIMRDILRAKAGQHEYVRRKLLTTGDRELIENSWRDDYWGWGPNRDGENMLGKLWMEVRAELRSQAL